MKQCSACKRNLPSTTEFFARRGATLRGQCRECRASADLAWRRANAEQVAEYQRTYHSEHREIRLAQMAERYAADKESYRARERRWRASAPEAEAARRRRRRALLGAAEGSHTPSEWAALRASYGGACLACGTVTAVVPDHVIPLYAGGSDYITNIQPLCVACNSAKGTTSTDYRQKE